MTVEHPGFGDPVLDSQACFRAVLDAMARPGTVHRVGSPERAPAPLDRSTAAVLLTLVDLDTPVWLDEAAGAAADWIAFHCGARRVGMGEGAFGVAVCPGGSGVSGSGVSDFPALGAFDAGSDDGPEGSATLLLQVGALGRGRTLVLEGPGLARPGRLQVEGLAEGFMAEWALNGSRYPRGIDVVLCAGDLVAAFPRTLRIGEG